MIAKTLVVDDEKIIRDEIVERLNDEGFVCVMAADGNEGLDLLIRDEEITVVLSDILMPRQTGLEMINTAKSEFNKDRDVEFIVLTGHGGSKEAIAALKLGVTDFLEKPIDLDHLTHVVQRAHELVLLRRANRHYELGLELDVQKKTLEIRMLLSNLEDAYGEALECLAVAAEYKDPETGNHLRRIGEYAQLVAKELGWSKARQRLMLLAAPLHDVGKIGTPESVLLKPGKLDTDEIAIMKQHAQNGYDILSHSKHPIMQAAANIAQNHHERWDGAGYPHAKKQQEISLEGRITAIADVFDALCCRRCYKEPWSMDDAKAEIIKGAGNHFDPNLVALFEAHFNDFKQIYLDRPE